MNAAVSFKTNFVPFFLIFKFELWMKLQSNGEEKVGINPALRSAPAASFCGALSITTVR